MSPCLTINRTPFLNTFVLFRRKVRRRLSCGVHGKGCSVLLNDKNFWDRSWMNSWALTGPFAREGIYWFLGFQRKICGRPGDEDFRRDSFLLNIFKKLLHCCFLLFPLNLKLIQLISFKTPTLLQSNWFYFFFLNCSILKWEMKFSSQTWSVHLSFFCSSLRFKVCFLLRGKYERVKTAAELSLRDDGPSPGTIQLTFSKVQCLTVQDQNLRAQQSCVYSNCLTIHNILSTLPRQKSFLILIK